MISMNKQFIDEWNAAYAAFRGAFDTPVMRMKTDNDYADDARRRMREFNELMQEVASAISPE